MGRSWILSDEIDAQPTDNGTSVMSVQTVEGESVVERCRRLGAPRRAGGPAVETKVPDGSDLGRWPPERPRTILATRDTGTRRREHGMKLSKHDLVQLLHTQGDNATADRVAESLPDEIDTERDRELLATVGLDQPRLAARLAASSIHVIG